MIRPEKLKKGDKIATISLSWGGAGDKEYRHRYELGKKRIEEVFGLQVVETKNSLKGSEYLSKHPEARAEDFMNAFGDKAIKAVFSNIGGEESIRLLPYIDFDIIKNNPKIFLGYSDTTVSHFMCYKAGLTSFYGPSVMVEFAENSEMHDYTVHWIKKTLFDSRPIGPVGPSEYWISQKSNWDNPGNNRIKRETTLEDKGYQLLQGKGKVRGSLIGGCIEVLDWLRGTELWPEKSEWEEKILFLEASEEKPSPDLLRQYLRNLNTMGVLGRINGLVFGKPCQETYFEEYKKQILAIVGDEAGRRDLPILYNMNFGHTSPMIVLPYGTEAEINCEEKSFSINGPGVTD